MSIGFGWITHTGSMVVVSDRRMLVNGIFNNDNTEKTFHIPSKGIIATHTGSLSFNGKNVSEHCETFCNNWNPSHMDNNDFEKLMVYLRDELTAEPITGFIHKSLRIIFLARIKNIPTRIYFDILPNQSTNELDISKPEVSTIKGTFKPIGNKVGYKTLYDEMAKPLVHKPTKHAELAMIKAIAEVQRVDGSKADCGGIPSIKLIT